MFNFFRLISYLEGISYLVILGNMLIIQKLSSTIYNALLFPVGMGHGILFILYVLLALYLTFRQRWSLKKSFLVLIVSVIPFGTFYSDRKWLNKDF